MSQSNICKKYPLCVIFLIWIAAGTAFAQATLPTLPDSGNAKSRVLNIIRKFIQAATGEILFDKEKTQELLGLEIREWRSYTNQGSQVQTAEGIRIKALPEFDYRYENIVRLSMSNNQESNIQSAFGNLASVYQVACIDKQEVDAITGGQGRKLPLTRFHRSPRYGGEYRFDTPLANGRFLSIYTSYEIAEEGALSGGGFGLCLSSLNVQLTRPLRAAP